MDAEDYYTVIKYPMDFNQILRKLRSGSYAKPEHCMEDIELIFDNCFLYNHEESDIFIMGKTLEHFYKRKILAMPREESPKKSLNLSVDCDFCGRKPTEIKKNPLRLIDATLSAFLIEIYEQAGKMYI